MIKHFSFNKNMIKLDINELKKSKEHDDIFFEDVNFKCSEYDYVDKAIINETDDCYLCENQVIRNNIDVKLCDKKRLHIRNCIFLFEVRLENIDFQSLTIENTFIHNRLDIMSKSIDTLKIKSVRIQGGTIKNNSYGLILRCSNIKSFELDGLFFDVLFSSVNFSNELKIGKDISCDKTKIVLDRVTFSKIDGYKWIENVLKGTYKFYDKTKNNEELLNTLCMFEKMLKGASIFDYMTDVDYILHKVITYKNKLTIKNKSYQILIKFLGSFVSIKAISKNVVSLMIILALILFLFPNHLYSNNAPIASVDILDLLVKYKFSDVVLLFTSNIFYILKLLSISLYFILISFLTIGYGDIVPYGFAKVISIICGLLGVTYFSTVIAIMTSRFNKS